MTANERRQAARLAADEGRHEEALREFIWFHHHALETEPSLRGVRLSYALRDWVALASRYPPALVALEQIRDAKSNALLNGDGDLDTFRDVEAINRDLDSVPRTYALFAQIAAANPALAQQCARKAFPALVAAGDFALAARFLPEPENYVRSLAETFNEAILSLESTPESNAPALQAFAYNYVCDVRLVLAVLTGGLVEWKMVRAQEASHWRWCKPTTFAKWWKMALPLRIALCSTVHGLSHCLIKQVFPGDAKTHPIKI